METRLTVKFFGLVLGCLLAAACAPHPLSDKTASEQEKPRVDLTAIESPIVLAGDATTAYRDPAAIYHDGTFYLYVTVGKIEPDKSVYWHTAWAKSRDLIHWTEPKIFTPHDRMKNFASPGCVVRDGEDWVLCLQTYPTPNGRQYGDQTSRIWAMRSRDLENWGPPELLRVKGPDVPVDKMGRMIDAFLFRDKDDPHKWWCFYKQNGASRSWSRDLKTWTFAGSLAAGENACVIVDRDEYVLFHSPGNGVGVKRSKDLATWTDEGLLTLGQKQWPWAAGRLTAGFVLDLRDDPRVGKALMFFHGSRWPERDPRGGWASHVSLGIAWSDDLLHWQWPGKPKDSPAPDPNSQPQEAQ